MSKPQRPDASASAEAMAQGLTPPKIVYAARGGRKTFFSFALLILLPFFTSLPAMLYARVAHGLWIDSVGLAVFASAFAIVMFLVLVELMMALRTRVVLGPNNVKMTLPSGRGPTPLLKYRSHDIAYEDIHSVETRREIYGGRLAPVLLKGAQLVTKDNETIKLGYVNEANVDTTFPYPEIAKHIADRARLPLIDRGNVRRSARAKFLGLRASSFDSEGETVDDEKIGELNHSHRNFVLALVVGLGVLLLLGIAADIASNNPIGL